MSTLDRAFIKAYTEAPATNAASSTVRPSRATPPAAPHQPIAEAARSPLGSVKKPLRPSSETAPARAIAATAPLSTFAPPPKVDQTLRAAYEVDELALPKACGDLLTHARRGWDRFADQLTKRLAAGEKCVAIASCSAGEGRTTIALAAARHLAARGVRTVVVDANFDNPTLAAACGITPQAGWSEVVWGERPLGEALIASAAEDLTLVPWQGRGKHARRSSDTLRIAAMFNTLQEHYDFVLVDTAPLDGPASISEFAGLADTLGLDAVYMAHDARTSTGGELRDTCDRLERAGVRVGGIIENFAAPAAPTDARSRLKLPAFASRLLASRGQAAHGESYV
jgi:Mrp family chromosome partitioning ATPase